MLALSSIPSFSQSAPAGGDQTTAPAVKAGKKAKKQAVPMKPFSQLALGGGISLMGVNLQAATNVNRYLNLRGTGNVFDYTVNNLNVNGSNNSSGGSSTGVDLNGKVNFATAGVSLDYYPFPTHGFRLSPGVIFYNQNGISANATAAAGNSITLNGDKYTTDAINPLIVNANLGLNSTKPAFTMTTGWGNMIPRKGGHWSFPFEIGAAFTGAPSLNMTLSGDGCLPFTVTSSGDGSITTSSYSTRTHSLATEAGCVDMGTDPTAQADLAAQVSKWKSDIDVLKVYPIFSFGAAYSFHIR
jgi:hypothetical protein